MLEEYGKERPSTSKTELMVLALSVASCIPSTTHAGTNVMKTYVRVHPSASSGSRTRVPDDIKALFLRDFANRIGALKNHPFALINPRNVTNATPSIHLPYDSNASEMLTGSPFLYPIAGQSTCRSPTCIVPP